MLPLKDKEYYPNIRRCLVSGFFMQIACLESEKRGAYSMLREGQDSHSENACHHSFGRSNTCDLLLQEVLLHPSTSLGHKPEWIVFHELALSSKLFIKTGHTLSMGLPAFQLVAVLAGTQIKPEWLLDVAPRGYFDPQKISEKSSARSKLERLSARRQDG